MQAILSFLSFIFWTVVILVGVLAFLAFRGYNGLRLLSENVKESWSNIGVTVRKQASLINQLISVVSSYAEGEKLVMLKISEDASLGTLQQMHQQSGIVLSAVNGMAQRFPDLKANGQYTTLMNSIQAVENQLEQQRQNYNAATKAYNVRRTSIPDVFYSKLLGFGEAPYLDFDGASEKDSGTLKNFVTDDGERLNQLLSHAGNRVLEASQQAGNVALAQGKQLAAAAKAKADELRKPALEDQTMASPPAAGDDATLVVQAAAAVQLIDVAGSAAGKTFDVPAKGLTIGRATTADIVVNDTLVSKHHVWLGNENGRWLLKDNASSNGTFVDDAKQNRVTEVELTNGLTVFLGSHGGTCFKVAFV